MEKKNKKLEELTKKVKPKRYRIHRLKYQKPEELLEKRHNKKYKEDTEDVDFKDLKVKLALIENLTNVQFDERTTKALYGFFRLRRAARQSGASEQEIKKLVTTDEFFKGTSKDVQNNVLIVINENDRFFKDDFKAIQYSLPDTGLKLLEANLKAKYAVDAEMAKFEQEKKLKHDGVNKEYSTGKGEYVNYYERLEPRNSGVESEEEMLQALMEYCVQFNKPMWSLLVPIEDLIDNNRVDWVKQRMEEQKMIDKLKPPYDEESLEEVFGISEENLFGGSTDWGYVTDVISRLRLLAEEKERYRTRVEQFEQYFENFGEDLPEHYLARTPGERARGWSNDREYTDRIRDRRLIPPSREEERYGEYKAEDEIFKVNKRLKNIKKLNGDYGDEFVGIKKKKK